MSIERYLKRIGKRDTVVYWGNPTAGAGAVISFDAPVEIGCMWKEKIEMLRDKSGREIISRASVYVTQDLDENGMLFHGELCDLTTAQQGDPRKVDAAYEIKMFLKTPSLYLRNRYNRKALL